MIFPLTQRVAPDSPGRRGKWTGGGTGQGGGTFGSSVVGHLCSEADYRPDGFRIKTWSRGGAATRLSNHVKLTLRRSGFFRLRL